MTQISLWGGDVLEETWPSRKRAIARALVNWKGICGELPRRVRPSDIDGVLLVEKPPGFVESGGFITLLEDKRPGDRHNKAQDSGQLSLARVEPDIQKVIRLWTNRVAHVYAWLVLDAESRYIPEFHHPDGREPVANVTQVWQDVLAEWIRNPRDYTIPTRLCIPGGNWHIPRYA